MASTTETTTTANGLLSFTLMWIGQVVSLFGSGLTAFALGVWVYHQTGSVTLFTFIAVAASLPGILLSPIAGALVDRWDRRRTLMLSDAGAAACTALLALLVATGRLELWHIYLLVAVSSAFVAFQFPAFSAATSLLVPSQHFGRAAGMMEFGEAGAQILAPLAAGALVAVLHLAGIFLIDLGTFLFSLLMLTLITIPRLPTGEAPPGPILAEAAFGWTYIRERPGLLALLGYFALLNLLVPFGFVLTTPLVLAFADSTELGVAMAAGGAGALAGSLVMSAWGGPRKRVYGVLGFGPLLGLGFVLAGLRPSVALIAAGLFLVFFNVPIINGSSQALWLSKVEPAVQGRVFAMRRMVAQLTSPIAFLAAGPLSDFLFEPLLASGGPLAGSIGRVLGTGPGRGIGFSFVVVGLAFLVVLGLGFLYPRLRRVNEELPDAIAVPPA